MRDVTTATAGSAMVSGAGETTTFKIAANAKAFKILIDGLYSDKIKAILRELSTNAFDSHIAAGCASRPFLWTLPTYFEPHFAVRDFGTGLSHDNVMHLYTTVFESTKDQDNDAVGKFGLGSKTPFAYGDSYGVTSWHGGMKRIYNAVLDRGIPKISLFHEEPSDEPSGLQVDFPVKAGDVRAFEIAAKRVALGFPVRPDSNADLGDAPAPAMSGPNWSLYSRDYGLGLTGFLVRQGCVLYPVDANALTSSDVSEVIQTLGGEAVILEMPIGSVEITPSRESLSYDEETVRNLSNAINGMFQQFIAEADGAVAQQPTLFEAYVAKYEVLSAIENRSLRDFVSARMRWRGRELKGSGVKIGQKRMSILRRHGASMEQITINRRRSKNRVTTDTQWNMEIEPHRMPTFVYYSGKPPTFLNGRLDEAKKKLGRNVMLLRNFVPGGFAEAALLASFGKPRSILPKFVDLMSIPFDRPDYRKTLASAQEWDDVYDKFKPMSHDNRVQAGDPNIFYLHTIRGMPKMEGVERWPGDVRHLWDNGKSLGIIPQDARLVGIPASRKDIAKNIPDDWQDLYDYAVDAVREKFDAEIASREIAQEKVVDDPKTRAARDFLRLLKSHETDIKDPTSCSLEILADAEEYLRPYEQGRTQRAMVKYITGREVLKEACGDLLEAMDVAKHEDAFWGCTRRLDVAYPLAQYTSCHTPSAIAAIIDYINLRDDSLRAKRDASEASLDAALADTMEGEGGYLREKTASKNVISIDIRKAA